MRLRVAKKVWQCFVAGGAGMMLGSRCCHRRGTVYGASRRLTAPRLVKAWMGALDRSETSTSTGTARRSSTSGGGS